MSNLNGYAPLPSVWEGEDAELLEHLLRFYPRTTPKRILDATVNGGRFWRGSKRRVVGLDIERSHNPAVVAENTRMPFHDRSFDGVVYDRPHIPNQGRDKQKDFNVSPDGGLPAAEQLMTDLASRLAIRPQITSDGLRSYIWGVERAFGADVDYGMLIKSYEEVDGRPELTGARPKPISGRPDPWHISTSYAERNNLNCRTFLRRLTRLTNGFSKRMENLEAALWLNFAHYNFVRIHGSLRMTSAMASGVEDHIWTIEELLNRGASS